MQPLFCFFLVFCFPKILFLCLCFLCNPFISEPCGLSDAGFGHFWPFFDQRIDPKKVGILDPPPPRPHPHPQPLPSTNFPSAPIRFFLVQCYGGWIDPPHSQSGAALTRPCRIELSFPPFQATANFLGPCVLALPLLECSPPHVWAGLPVTGYPRRASPSPTSTTATGPPGCALAFPGVKQRFQVGGGPPGPSQPAATPSPSSCFHVKKLPPNKTETGIDHMSLLSSGLGPLLLFSVQHKSSGSGGGLPPIHVLCKRVAGKAQGPPLPGRCRPALGPPPHGGHHVVRGLECRARHGGHRRGAGGEV